MSDLLDQRDDYRRMCDAKHPRKNQPLRAACQEGRSKCQHQGVISNTVLDHVGFFCNQIYRQNIKLSTGGFL